MLKRFTLLACSLLLLLPTSALAATTSGEPDKNQEVVLPLLITEIYPNAVGIGSSEANNSPAVDTPEEDIPLLNEYIEMFNPLSIPLDLTNYSLSRAGITTTTSLEGIVLQPQEYLVILPDFALVNSFTEENTPIIYLSYAATESEEVARPYTYASGLKDSESWSLIGNEWSIQPPTPGAANPEPVIEEIPDDNNIEDDKEEADEESDQENETPQACAADFVMINEIVANPSGADSEGGEYIELYNNGTEIAELDGCWLSTDKTPSISLAGVTMQPGAYYAVELFSELLNTGGTVSFVTSSTEYSLEYPQLGDDRSWSIIDGEWQESTIMTPNAANQPTPPEPIIETTAEKSLNPCPEGKFRNPETNRCKTIVDAASSLLPCAAGSIRNPETNRCRKITALTSGSSLKPCRTDQERNPATNRCRKISTTSNELKPCDEGYERNPQTNRCRKVAAVLSSTITPPDKQSERGLHPNVIVLMTFLAVAYGLYEYRLDFANIYHRLKKTEKRKLLNWRKSSVS